jgi:hypothetical protein
MKARSKVSYVLAAAGLLLAVRASYADVAEVSGKVTWGQRAICDRPQGRKLVFSGDSGKKDATIGQGGRYSVKVEPGRYRVTLKCGGTDIKSLDVISYPTPTHQDLAF